MSAPMDPRREHDEHGEWDALAVGWALSALDPDDEALFAAHLPGCARCTATVRESLYTVADLAYALPDETPPASMKARLMAAVAAEPRTAPAESPAPEEQEVWPLGEPHPGTPGFRTDWFAEHQPPAKNEPFPADRPSRHERAGSPEALPPVAEPRRARPGQEGDRPEPTPPDLARPDLARPDLARPDLGRPDLGRPDLAGTDLAGGDLGRTDTGRTQPARPGLPRVETRGDDLGGRHAAPSGSRSDDRVVVPMASRRRRFLTAVAAAAAVAVIAALGVWNVQLRSDQNSLQQIVAQREAAIQQLTANGPARVAALTSDGKPSPTRKATLVVRGNQVQIIVETLGETPADSTFWLWTLNCDPGTTPSNTKPVRGFTVTQSAFSVHNIGSDADAATATCFAISVEPGTATPTSPHHIQAVGQPGT